MLEQLLKLYTMAMAVDVRSPMPHLFGPPGCGKSTLVEILAHMVGVQLHIINVSRLSPLEVEGVQMPHGSGEEMVLKMLPATFWTQLKEGDVLLLDELLRGFPEVFNGMLDIFTSRRAGSFVLPRVFIIGASNSLVTYDKALEDRLLHLPVTDPRKSKPEKKRLSKLIVDKLGLLPEMVDSAEMGTLMDTEVLPMFEILDNLKNKQSSSPASLKGRSIRNLIGQAQLREIQSAELADVISTNNRRAMQGGKAQYVFLKSGADAKAEPKYEGMARKLQGNTRLTEVQALNLELNLQLIEMEKIRQERGTDDGGATEPDLDDLLS